MSQQKLPKDPEAEQKLAAVPKERMPGEVLDILSTPLAVGAFEQRRQQGFTDQQSSMLAVAGSLAAALGETPELAGDLDPDAVAALLETAKEEYKSIPEIPENAKTLETMRFIVDVLEGAENSCYNN